MKLVTVLCRKDNEWHHLAVTWSFDTGKTELFFDGVAKVPTWQASAGRWESKGAKEGGVDPNMAAGTLRLPNGEPLYILSHYVSKAVCTHQSL